MISSKSHKMNFENQLELILMRSTIIWSAWRNKKAMADAKNGGRIKL